MVDYISDVKKSIENQDFKLFTIDNSVAGVCEGVRGKTVHVKR